MLEGHEAVEVAAGCVADDGERDDDGEEDAGTLHHDDAVLVVEVGGEQQGHGEEDSSDEEGCDAPGEWDAAFRDEKHAEAGGHAEGRHDDLLQGHGGAALADPPEEDRAETEKRDDGREDGFRQNEAGLSGFVPRAEGWVGPL